VAAINTKASTVDNGQLWFPLKELQKMARLDDEATMVVVGNER
jgi:hypothetical protein